MFPVNPVLYEEEVADEEETLLLVLVKHWKHVTLLAEENNTKTRSGTQDLCML